MFKNIQLFRISPQWAPNLESVQTGLESIRFVDCGASQERSTGWTEPRGEKHGALVEAIGGQWILKVMTESKLLPGSVVKEEAKKRIEVLEQQIGRKPGKKEKKEIIEDVRNALMAKAFTKKSSAYVWIDPSARLMVVEASSTSRSDEILTLLVKSLDGFVAIPINTHQSPAASMSIWLNTQEVPSGFTTDRDCALKDATKASVKYAKHALDIEEIRGHIAAGKVPTQLAMTWDSRVSFVLTDTSAIKKIEFLDVVFEQATASDKDSTFDSDVAIATGELCKLIPDLLEILGGEVASSEPATSHDGTIAVTPVQESPLMVKREPDPLYEQAVNVVREQNKVSISLVQRHLKIGYNHAARLIEDMEIAHLVSPMNSSGQRCFI